MEKLKLLYDFAIFDTKFNTKQNLGYLQLIWSSYSYLSYILHILNILRYHFYNRSYFVKLTKADFSSETIDVKSSEN